MKYLFLMAICSLCAPAAEYSEGVRYALEQLRTSKTSAGVPLVAGISTNIGGSSGTFYLLWPYFFARATPEDVALMLKDPSPVVRLLGARRVLEPHLRPLPVESLTVLKNDTTEVVVGPMYESSQRFATMTVAAVVAEMQREPRFLFRLYYQEHGQIDYLRETQSRRSVQAISAAPPDFPLELTKAGIGGEVLVSFVLQADGSVTDVLTGKSSHREFEAPARAAVLRWRFAPAGAGDTRPLALECRLVFRVEDE